MKPPHLEFFSFNASGQRVMQRVRPLGDRVIVRRPERVMTEVGGLLAPLPKRAEMAAEGEVVALGPDVAPGTIEVGDAVLFGGDDGVVVRLGERAEEYLVLGNEQVVAILTRISPLLERDRMGRMLSLRNNWVLMEWEKAAEIKLCGGKLALARTDTYERAHFTGIVKMVGPDVGEDVKGEVGKRVFFDRWAHEFREMYWYEPGVDGRGERRYALILDHRLNCVLPDRVKVESEGFEEEPDDGPSAVLTEITVKPDVGRVYG